MELHERILQARASGAVERFHIMRSHRAQTVADHSHGVAVLAMLIDPNCSAVVLKAALSHDFHERDTGDMPSTAKWLYPELAAAMAKVEGLWNKANGYDWKLTDKEVALLKFCDYLELFLWSHEEVRLGNKFAAEPLVNITRVLDKMQELSPAQHAVYFDLRQIISNETGMI